jgi:hypothetical protein
MYNKEETNEMDVVLSLKRIHLLKLGFPSIKNKIK